VKLKFSLFIPAILWFIITTVLLVLPGPDIPSVGFLDIIYFDKWVHAGLFGGMTFLFSLPFFWKLNATKKLLIYIAIVCVLYGVAMEYVQKYIAFERDFDYFDMVADGVGCIIGYFASAILKRRLEKKSSAI
jgi:VanZ family protein